MKLSELAVGKDAVILDVDTPDIALRKHILEMGLTPGTEVTLMKIAPMGDPLEIRVRGYELTIRKDDAFHITISNVHDMHEIPADVKKRYVDAVVHPMMGESDGRRRKKTIRSGELLSFALVGNQNCGKTTLFNQLTGSNQHVGNFPGVTVSRKDGYVQMNIAFRK